jgi:periodic tryptophan protein 2
VLAGHTGPISAISFNPANHVLASVSWDKSLILWEVYESRQRDSPFMHASDVVAVAYRPDGMQVCTSSLDGLLSFWDTDNGDLIGTIEGRYDIMGGRLLTDARTLKNTEHGKHFKTIAYTPDGNCLLGGGDSKYICMYDVKTRILLRKFQISRNESLDGILDNPKLKLTDVGPLDLLEPDYSSGEDKHVQELPGTAYSRGSKKQQKQPITTNSLAASPTGRAWSAATTEGLLIYSIDETMVFDPFDLDEDVTPQNILKALKRGEYLKALVMSFRLNEKEIILKVIEGIPYGDIQICVQGFPIAYLGRLLTFLGSNLEESVHIEHQQLWVHHTLTVHGTYMEDNGLSLLGQFRTLLKAITKWHKDLGRLCEDNLYTLSYLAVAPKDERESGSESENEKVDSFFNFGGESEQEVESDEDVEGGDAGGEKDDAIMASADEEHGDEEILISNFGNFSGNSGDAQSAWFDEDDGEPEVSSSSKKQKHSKQDSKQPKQPSKQQQQQPKQTSKQQQQQEKQTNKQQQQEKQTPKQQQQQEKQTKKGNNKQSNKVFIKTEEGNNDNNTQQATSQKTRKHKKPKLSIKKE